MSLNIGPLNLNNGPLTPLTFEELNDLDLLLINNKRAIYVLSKIEIHKDEFVQPGAQEYIRRIRESINENELEQYSTRTITALRSLIRTMINPMEEDLIPFDSIITRTHRSGGRRRKHRKTRSKTRKTRKVRSRR